MKEEMIQVRVWASTNFINSTDEQIIEVDKDYWESMTDAEKEEYMFDVAMEMIEWGFEEIEGEQE